MKTILSPLTAVFSIALASALPVWGQTSAASSAKNKTPEALSAQDAKEQSEDAALLQQLEVDAQQSRTETKTKNRSTASPRTGSLPRLGPGGVPFQVQNLMVRPSAGSKALVIRTGDADPKAQTDLEEDLSVMSHLLAKAIDELPGGQGNADKVMGIDVFFKTGGMALRSLYLDNYGALFFLNVNFPLVAPQEKRQEDKQVGDSAWEDARQELYGQHPQGRIGGEPAEEYNQEKVDKLKETLLVALKNGTNIRGIKPNEFVTIWVCGGSSANGRFRVMKNNTPGNFGGGNVEMLDPGLSPARRTILTLRVAKADIDAYAKGKVAPDDFQKHVRITAYTGDAAGGAAEGFVVGGFGGGGRTRF